ncbi:MAG: type II toxin-antitoxin system VapC family toxin [Betaproteobacteria bacterium]|nr:type II toxin-antitoxin system VapC family toxin [Betaproteobacteria bacterium]
MSVTVIDASAVAAVVFDEPEAAPVLASVEQSILAPSLLRYEMASICAVKLMRDPRQAKITLDRYRLFTGLEIEFAEPEWDLLPVLARQWELTAYDAAYLQLALTRNAPLVTLDARLAAAYDKAARLASRRP